MSKLSIKALIVATFVLILALALGATASLWVTDRMTREALARHEQAMNQAAELRGSTAVADTYRVLKQVTAQATAVTLTVRILTLLCGLMLAVLVYRRVARLVADTEDFAERIERGDFAARFATDAAGETAALAAALNRMVDRLREAAEGEAAASRRLSFLVSATPTVIYSARAAGGHGVTYISPNVLQQLGHAPQDFLADAEFWVRNIHPDDRERVLARIDKLLSEGCVADDYRFRHQDGSWRWMYDEAALVRDATGAPLEMIGSWTDITARKALEASITRRDAILNAVAYGSARFLAAGEEPTAAQWALTVEAVLSHLGEATDVSRLWVVENILATDGDLRTRPIHHWALPEFAPAVEAVPSADGVSYREEGTEVEALRLRRGEILQLRPADLPDGMRARFAQLGIKSQLLAPIAVGGQWWGFVAFDDCVEERHWTEHELEALRAAANLFGAAVAARAGREELRANVEMLGSVLAKLKRQSAEIERQNAELTQASRMKSEFLAAITHELKTPLNGILGFADLLDAGSGGALTAEQRSHVGEILGAGRQLNALVNRLLELAQIDAGKKPVAPQETDLGALLRQAAAARARAAQARGIALEVVADGVAVLDPALVRHLLDELIDNAIKFTREGGSVTLKAGLSPSPQPSSIEGEGENHASTPRPPRGGAEAGLREALLPAAVAGELCKASPGVGGEGENLVVIDVIDSGIGIAAEDRARLFEPFVQLDGALNRQYPGTGLGLALARRIAELHGGSITVDSAPGQGSTFRVRLPCRPPPAPARETVHRGQKVG